MLRRAYLSAVTESRRCAHVDESVAKGLLEVPGYEGIEPLAKATVAAKEEPAFRGEPRAALGSAPGPSFEQLEASRALELAKIPPRRSVRHAHALDGLLEGAEPFHRLEEFRAPFPQLGVVPEAAPALEPRPALARAPPPAYLVRTRPAGTA